MTGDHYFSPQPGAADVRSDIEFTVAGRDYALTVAPGVFSASRLDPGTAVLLRKADLPTAADPGPFLDLGCGYGPITCVLAEHAPAAAVYAVDVNARARELTMVNAHRVGVADRVQVVDPDAVPPELRFRQLWSNPPIRIGKPELRALLSRWLPRLAPDGVGWLVIARYLGGDSVQQWLREQGWQVDRHASQKGYRVLRVTHPAD
ncbi:class I SAM-dependent methyltransferase [Micromonospora sp. LOL_023]|uniref:class I SAM-dependent methyltransferase n=1 Tax=Micromonospora sp. LOL_023 TaxID=3345418 RepID=UPI003A8AF231